MSEHELEKLLGGFAADMLTAEERQLLYTAALHDQKLFNALADEQAFKELLADPVIRRRLLQALSQPSASGSGKLSWLEWLKRPTGLAFASGLAAAVFAVILGTKIYQDSLRQAAQSVPTEDTRPMIAPPATPPLPSPLADYEIRQKGKASAKDFAKNDQPFGKASRSEPSSDVPRSQEPTPLDALSKAPEQPPSQDDARTAPGDGPAPTRASEQATASNDQRAEGSSPLAATHQPLPAPASAPMPAPTVSARALFYETQPIAEQPRRAQTATPEQKAESPKKRAERNIGLLGKLQDAKRLTDRPLGIRYSLIMKGPGGIDMEVDPSTTVGADDVPRLAVQANESGYLSILSATPSSDKPTPLFPSSGEGKVIGGTTVAISLSQVFESHPVRDQVRLVVFFSRTPLPLPLPLSSTTESVLIEHIDPGQSGEPAEQATYVVEPAPPLRGTLRFEIPLSLRP